MSDSCSRSNNALSPADSVMRFTAEPLDALIAHLSEPRSPGEIIELEALDPDLHEATHFNGELVTLGGVTYRHRAYQAWMDLAQSLGYSFLTPHSSPQLSPLVRIRLRVMARQDWHAQSLPSGHPEKYGVESQFARLSKVEEPHFHQHLLECARWAGISDQTRVLSLGVNSGDELALCLSALSPAQREALPAGYWVGLDHSASAIERARERHLAPQLAWRVGDLRALDDLQLGVFDLILCLNTLHSPLIDERREIKRWVKEHLSPHGAIIISLPQSRYQGTHQLYGDHSFHSPYLKPSKNLKMISSIQRYLQQHRFEVNTRGKYTLFLVGKRVQ